MSSIRFIYANEFHQNRKSDELSEADVDTDIEKHTSSKNQ